MKKPEKFFCNCKEKVTQLCDIKKKVENPFNSVETNRVYLSAVLPPLGESIYLP